MLNAMIWALACFGVVAADIALSVVLFSALGVASVFMGFSIDGLDIQLLQAVAQTASFLWRCCGGVICGRVRLWHAGNARIRSAGERVGRGSASPALS